MNAVLSLQSAFLRLLRLAPFQSSLRFLWVLSLFGIHAAAQGSAPRIAGSLQDGGRKVLAGSRSPFAIPANDLGALPSGTALHGVTLVFNRSPEQEAALQQLLSAQKDPTSPQFHHWLTPEGFAAQFGLAEADLATVKAWLQTNGFSIDQVGRSHDRIAFSGAAGQIAAVFGSPLHRYRTGDNVHFAPAAELSLPSALAPLVVAVERLSDYRPAPPFHPLQAAPQFTSAKTQGHLLDPLDLATQYDLNPVYAAGFDGSGQAIAVVGQSWIPPSDLLDFHVVLSKGGPGNFSEVLVPNTGVSAAYLGAEAEADLDVEYSSSMALGASVYLVYVGDSDNANVFDALSYAVTENIAPIISISYGECESDLSATQLNSLLQTSEQATAQGQTIVASAGDRGPDTCYGDASLSTAQQTTASVDVPADLPGVTGVGGLQMMPGTFSIGNTQYFAPSSTGSDLYNSLLSYVPETVWNEDSASFSLAAGGGGISTIVQRPDWQTGVPGIPAGPFRLVPDLALEASIQSPGFLFCTSDASAFTSGQNSSCFSPGASDELTGTYSIAGGTSFGAPVLAGMLAVLNQATHAIGQGNINPILYGLAANNGTYASAFHDITSGSTQCTAAATVCAAVGQAGYPAGVGYDEASGLGSFDFANLLSVWPATPATDLLATNVYVLPSSFTPPPGSAQQLSISVDEQTVYTTVATGSVEVLLDGEVIDPAAPLLFAVNGYAATATATYTAPGSPGGHVLQVIYPGDSLHAPSSGTNAITVGSAEATGSFSLSAGNLSLSENSTGSSTVTVSPAGGYTGVANLSLTNLTASGTAGASVELCYRIGQVSTYSGLASTTLIVGQGTACSSTSSSGMARMKHLTIRPKAQAAVQVPPATPRPAAAALALLLFGFLPFRRFSRRLPASVVALLLLVAGLGLGGCGGSNSSTATSPSNPSPVLPALVFTATLSGSDSVNTAIMATTNFTITLAQ